MKNKFVTTNEPIAAPINSPKNCFEGAIFVWLPNFKLFKIFPHKPQATVTKHAKQKVINVVILVEKTAFSIRIPFNNLLKKVIVKIVITA